MWGRVECLPWIASICCPEQGRLGLQAPSQSLPRWILLIIHQTSSSSILSRQRNSLDLVVSQKLWWCGPLYFRTLTLTAVLGTQSLIFSNAKHSSNLHWPVKIEFQVKKHSQSRPDLSFLASRSGCIYMAYTSTISELFCAEGKEMQGQDASDILQALETHDYKDRDTAGEDFLLLDSTTLKLITRAAKRREGGAREAEVVTTWVLSARSPRSYSISSIHSIWIQSIQFSAYLPYSANVRPPKLLNHLLTLCHCCLNLIHVLNNILKH